MRKKEFHALIESQMKKYFGNKDRGPQTKRAQGSGDSGITTTHYSWCSKNKYWEHKGIICTPEYRMH